MAKERSRVADYAVYLVIRCVVCFLQTLSFDLACKVADGLAWLAYRLNRRHREVALDNLRQAYPGQYTEAQLEKMVQGVYRHFCGLMIEIVHIPRRLHVNTWRKHIEMVNIGPFVECLLSGRPVLVVSGHLGNWEMAGFSLNLLGFPTHAIARPLDNPYMDDFLRRFRESTGQKILAKHGDFDKMQAVLDSGGVMATLADQDAGPRGVFVDFFGRPASTHKAVALLALEHKVPMVVIGNPRIDGRYHVLVEEVIYPEDYANDPDAVRTITQRYTTALERVIRKAPTQYFWLHRRWKHQPQVKGKKKAAA